MIEIIKKYKAYIILFIILITYLLIAFIFFKKNEDNENQATESYLVTNNSKYTYKDKKFEKVVDTEKYNWKDYNIYINNEFFGNYKLQFNKRWYIYNEQRDSIKYEGDIIATSNIDMNVYGFDKSNITEEEQTRINNYLEKQNIDLVQYETNNSKIEIDLDNDNKEEKIYIVNSQINNNPENKFSLILIEKNNNFEILVSKVIAKDVVDKIELFNIYGFIDIDNDEKKEILVSRMIFSQPEKDCEMIFKSKNKKYEKMTDC